MARYPCNDGNGLKKGPWTPEEDKKLLQCIQKHGHANWKAFPKLAGLNRCGKSCRLRWTNYLRPDIKRGKFSQEEEEAILELHSILGNKWSAIATQLPGRTDNEIKNFWNTHLKKKLIQMGFDPMTHCLRTDLFSGLLHLIALANLTDSMGLLTWEEKAIRLQEAIQLAKFQFLQCLLQSPSEVGSSNSSNSLISITSMDALPSPKENMVLNPSQVENDTPFPQQLNDQMLTPMPFNPAQDMQFPSKFLPPKSIEITHDTNLTVFNQGDYTPKSPLPPSPPSLLIENPISNPGDDCTTSSYNEAVQWSEFFDEDYLFS